MGSLAGWGIAKHEVMGASLWAYWMISVKCKLSHQRSIFPIILVCVCVCVSCHKNTYRYALNQTVIFSGIVARENCLPNVTPTAAWNSLFTTKVAICSGVPSRLSAPMWLAALISFREGSFSGSTGARMVGSGLAVWGQERVFYKYMHAHTDTHTHTHTLCRFMDLEINSLAKFVQFSCHITLVIVSNHVSCYLSTFESLNLWTFEHDNKWSLCKIFEWKTAAQRTTAHR